MSAFDQKEHSDMTMRDWAEELDRQLFSNRRPALSDKGRVSHRQAIEKAEKEFDLYRAKEMKQPESDFGRTMKELTDGSSS